MTDEGGGESGAGEQSLLDAVFGDRPDDADLVERVQRKTKFAPWHHPVKQIVRTWQWEHLCVDLINKHRPANRREILRYFTLPGADLLDVRVLGEALAKQNARVEYFGFNAAMHRPGAQAEDDDLSFSAESALRQAGRITDDALILPDRLEDIAIPGSQASNQLGQRLPFDVINIDACNHLGFEPAGRSKSTFDALERLLAHQLQFREPWLLFVTTRSDPELLGAHFTKMQRAILDNIDLSKEEFAPALAECIGGKLATLSSDLTAKWGVLAPEFLKLYSLGLGKYLLHFFHGQHNLSADVELASAYAYSVYKTTPDMLSLAFRIKPHAVKVMPPSARDTSVTAPLEPAQGVKLVAKAKALYDIDAAILDDKEMRDEAVVGTARLLESANFDLPAWREWLQNLAVRPMTVEDAVIVSLRPAPAT